MSIHTFDDLLLAARAQAEPQRLLFVFAKAELPEDSTAEQRHNFQAGQGGALVPLMSVDKSPDELDSFEGLVEESLGHAQDWAIVFVASLPGGGGRAPTGQDAERPLQRMIESIKGGSIGGFLPFDRSGEPVVLS